MFIGDQEIDMNIWAYEASFIECVRTYRTSPGRELCLAFMRAYCAI